MNRTLPGMFPAFLISCLVVSMSIPTIVMAQKAAEVTSESDFDLVPQEDEPLIRPGEQKIKVKDGKGKTVFSIKPKSDGAKLVDAKEKEIARFNSSPGKLKIKDAKDRVLGYIVISDRAFKIKDAQQTKVLFKLQPQSDGDWKLEDGHEKTIYRIKKRDYGYEVETPKKKTICKIKVKGDKTSLRDAKDKTVYYTNRPTEAIAFACLGLEAIREMPIRAGLMASIHRN